MYVHSTGRYGKHQVTVIDMERIGSFRPFSVIGTWSFWFGFNAGRFRYKAA